MSTNTDLIIRRIITAFILVACLSGCGEKKFSSSRLELPAGNFSYVTPDGWNRSKLVGIDFLIVSTHVDYGIKPNIFVDGILPTSNLEQAADQTLATKKSMLDKYQVEQRNQFITQSGLSGIKITAVHFNRQQLPLATFQYLVKDSSRIISIACTCADAVKSKYEPLFDSAIHSLQSEPKNSRN